MGRSRAEAAEWSEEDETWINYFYLLLEFAYEKDTRGLGKKAIEAKMWLKSLPERFNLQPKQEWDEKDEKQIRQIERIVAASGCTKQLQERIHNWFNSRYPQPHWKPTEEQQEVDLEEDETVTDCNEYSTVEEELDAFIKSGKAIKEENCGT